MFKGEKSVYSLESIVHSRSSAESHKPEADAAEPETRESLSTGDY